MNERIQTLALLCYEECGDYHLGSIVEFNHEKFVELIVKECVNICDNYQDLIGNDRECFTCRKIAYGIADNIEKHFGVKA